MTTHDAFDLLVIGAGPGGYAAAFRAADLGRSVTLVDPRPTLGGVCLNEGCIPSKALLHAAELIMSAGDADEWGISMSKPVVRLDQLRARKDGIVGSLTNGLAHLAKRRNVRIIRGTARFASSDQIKIASDGETLEGRFRHAIIAAGSSPVRLPGWPDDRRILDSTGALQLADIPEKLAIVGGGIIGLEMATIYSALGSSVTIVELTGQIAGEADSEAVGMLRDALIERGCVIHTGTGVVEVRPESRSITLVCEGDFSDKLQAHRVIQAVGRRANGTGVGAEEAGLTVAADGTIGIDRQCRTGVANIFAIGDVTGAPMLAHRATHQGKIAAEVACGQVSAFDTDLVAAVCYTNPELAWVGLSQEQAKAAGIACKVSKFPWAASGRNLASGGKPGLTKIVWCPDSRRILGATIIGAHAGELIGEIVLAMEMGANLEDVALTVHAHPTLGETTAFAAEIALGTCTDL